MAKRMLIDATHSEETRVVVVNGNKLDELDFDLVDGGPTLLNALDRRAV